MLRWAQRHSCPWDEWNGAWERAHGCPWNKNLCEYAPNGQPKTHLWVRQQPVEDECRTSTRTQLRNIATPCKYDYHIDPESKFHR